MDVLEVVELIGKFAEAAEAGVDQCAGRRSADANAIELRATVHELIMAGGLSMMIFPGVAVALNRREMRA